jgi:hypothetical protein
MSASDDPQPSLFIDTPAGRKRVYRNSRTSARKRLPVLQPSFPVRDAKFTPLPGVPKTRGDCPVERPCPHLMCRHHLFRLDAENRAGRPGLANVDRDERGLTKSITGDAGETRPGTKVPPKWLELERHVRAAIETDDTGRICAINVLGDAWGSGQTGGNAEAAWAAMRLHEGEALRVMSEDGTWTTHAWYRDGAVVLERAPQRPVLAVTITRVRGVPSCALDEIDRIGVHSNEQAGDALGRHRTLIAREGRKAAAHAIEVAKGMGMTEHEFMQGFAELRRQNGR